MGDERQGQIDDAYRAIGRYAVEFSQLVFSMRETMNRYLARPYIHSREIALVFGELPAQLIANAFFGMCAMVADFDDDETKVAKAFRNAVNRTIEERNYFFHGDWRVWGDPAMVDRVRPVRSKGPFEHTNLTAAELDERVIALQRLRRAITEFGVLCLGTGHNRYRIAPDLPCPTRVRDIFVMDGAKVARAGPWADHIFRQPYE